MSVAKRSNRPILWTNSAFLILMPIVAAWATTWFHIHHGITWQHLLALVFCWWTTGMGITAGYHRLFSHRGYTAGRALRFFYAVAGAAACQNSVIAWCSEHRRHHSQTDTDDDPYNAKEGFLYSHMTWAMQEGLYEGEMDGVPDLWKDPILTWQHTYYLPINAAFNGLLVALLGWLSGDYLGMFIVAGLLRIVVVQHTTFFINSLAHMWGTQPYSRANTSRDNWFLSFLTLGEGYHNYHHAFQWDYRNGPRWYQFDPTKWFIWTGSKLGLASKLRRTPEDVILRVRYEENRDSFTQRLEAWGEGKMEEWAQHLHDFQEAREGLRAKVQNNLQQARRKAAENLQGARDNLQEAGARAVQTWHGASDDLRGRLQERLVDADRSLDSALQDLKVQRQAWAQQHEAWVKAQTAELRTLAKTELEELRRALKQAQDTARRALAEFDALVLEYSKRYLVLPQPA